MAAYLLIRGMKTLDLRIRRQNESALAIARWLRDQPAVSAVFYPGLEDGPYYEIARRQMRGFGSVLGFSLKGGQESVCRVLPRLRLRTALRISAPSRRSPARPPPPATSNAPPKSAAPWAFPKA